MSISRIWAWSPDGKHLSFMSAGVDGVRAGKSTSPTSTSRATLTDLRRLKLDPDSSGENGPNWSPDSSQVAFLLEKDFKRQVGIFNADGTGFRVIGPETSASNILGYTWSPDGKTLHITEFPDYEPAREKLRKMWSVDVATGAQTEIQTPVGSLAAPRALITIANSTASRRNPGAESRPSRRRTEASAAITHMNHPGTSSRVSQPEEMHDRPRAPAARGRQPMRTEISIRRSGRSRGPGARGSRDGNDCRDQPFRRHVLVPDRALWLQLARGPAHRGPCPGPHEERGDAAHGHQDYEMTITWTVFSHPDHQYVVHTQGQARDVPVRLVGGTVPGSSLPGPTSAARSSPDERRRARHARSGPTQVTSLRDTLGDSDPSNDVWLEDTNFGTRGMFPSLDLDLCEVFLEAAAG